jgi:hypothetical protein
MNEPYDLPIGWYRDGLNVREKYGNDNVRLSSNNIDGEWSVIFMALIQVQ